jgi:S-adenosylmethionine:diacylglycerol 3-amino-3-carboxypropyl transferase
MLPRLEMASTPWRHGPFKAQLHQLSFGQTYEDSGIELQAFKPRSRVFCIAGAGSTARALAAAGHHVTAVDINPLQLGYAQSRAAGGPLRIGVAERLLVLGRNLAKLAGWSPGKLTDFLNLSDPGEQVEYWDLRLDTRAWRAAVDTLLAPRLLGICYRGPFIESLPQDFGLRLRQRLRRTWATHSNRSNPYAASLLLGRPPVEPNAPEFLIQFVCADAADFLECCPPATFDGFSLSNIGDGASPDYLWRLRVAIDHAAAPNAIVVARTFAEPGPNTLANWARLDRSLLWGVVEVSRTAEICPGGKSCYTF